MQARHLDIYMLRCLVALVTEGHVTRAAERMAITQPAMSATLARLRAMFADPLLVRTEKGMVSTPRARQLADRFQQALDLVDQAMAEGTEFEPATATERFRIAASETLGYLLMPSLIAHVRQLAPTVQPHCNRQSCRGCGTSLRRAGSSSWLPSSGMRRRACASRRSCASPCGSLLRRATPRCKAD